MNTKLTMWIAAMCVSAGAFAQTAPATGNTPDTPTAGQSTKNVGEPYPAASANTGNMADSKHKKSKSAKTKAADCAAGHTDGHANTVAGSSDMASANCDKMSK